jgi:hypothetical protein
LFIYFFSLGCGDKNCQNKHCRSSSGFQRPTDMSPNALAAYALQILSNSIASPDDGNLKHTHKHTRTQISKQTDRQTNKQTNTPTSKQTNKQTQTALKYLFCATSLQRLKNMPFVPTPSRFIVALSLAEGGVLFFLFFTLFCLFCVVLFCAVLFCVVLFEIYCCFIFGC